MSADEIRRINRRVLDLWAGMSHGGIDPEELEEALARKRGNGTGAVAGRERR